MNGTGRATCGRRARQTLSRLAAAGRAAPPGSALAPAGAQRGARAPRHRRLRGRRPAGLPLPRRLRRTGAPRHRRRSSPGARRTGGCQPVQRASRSAAAAVPVCRPAPRVTGAERSRPSPARRQRVTCAGVSGTSSHRPLSEEDGGDRARARRRALLPGCAWALRRRARECRGAAGGGGGNRLRLKSKLCKQRCHQTKGPWTLPLPPNLAPLHCAGAWRARAAAAGAARPTERSRPAQPARQRREPPAPAPPPLPRRGARTALPPPLRARAPRLPPAELWRRGQPLFPCTPGRAGTATLAVGRERRGETPPPPAGPRRCLPRTGGGWVSAGAPAPLPARRAGCSGCSSRGANKPRWQWKRNSEGTRGCPGLGCGCLAAGDFCYSSPCCCPAGDAACRRGGGRGGGCPMSSREHVF